MNVFGFLKIAWVNKLGSEELFFDCGFPGGIGGGLLELLHGV